MVLHRSGADQDPDLCLPQRHNKMPRVHRQERRKLELAPLGTVANADSHIERRTLTALVNLRRGFSVYFSKTFRYGHRVMNVTRRLFLFLFCFLAAGARGVEMRAMPVAELTQKAELVVAGKVLSKTSQRDEAGRIYTKIQLEISETWKGDAATNVLTVVHGGGTVGDERLVVSNQVEFEPGEEVVAFLVFNQRREGVCLGLSQGKFHVWNDSRTGEKLVRNPFHGVRSAAATAPSALPGPPVPGRLTFTDLKQQVQGGAK